MATNNNPSRLQRKIHITGDGEYNEEFISRRTIRSDELVILDPVYTKADYFKALFFPDKYDIILIWVSMVTLWFLRLFIGIGMYEPSALIFTGIIGIFYYTTRFAYFSVGDLIARIQKTQNPNRLINKLDLDFSFWGLYFNLALIGLGSYLL